MSETNISNPAYRIETERLVVRCYNPSDAELLDRSVTESGEHLKTWMPWAHDEPKSFEDRVRWLRRARGMFDLGQDYTYGIFNTEESFLIGSMGLHTRLGENELEIGYWIHKDFISQGLATEATAALVRVAFEIIKIHRIEIHCDPGNHASASVPKKLRFTHEGTLRAKIRFLDRWSDSMIWAMLENEYPGSPASEALIKAFDANGVALA
jgi:RimJ/RimL family protein N-acetyltransferase